MSICVCVAGPLAYPAFELPSGIESVSVISPWSEVGVEEGVQRELSRVRMELLKEQSRCIRDQSDGVTDCDEAWWWLRKFEKELEKVTGNEYESGRRI